MMMHAQGWSLKVIDTASVEAGGYRTVIAEVNGEKVYSKLKYEAGVHRVQVCCLVLLCCFCRSFPMLVERRYWASGGIVSWSIVWMLVIDGQTMMCGE